MIIFLNIYILLLYHHIAHKYLWKNILNQNFFQNKFRKLISSLKKIVSCITQYTSYVFHVYKIKINIFQDDELSYKIVYEDFCNGLHTYIEGIIILKYLNIR